MWVSWDGAAVDISDRLQDVHKTQKKMCTLSAAQEQVMLHRIIFTHQFRIHRQNLTGSCEVSVGKKIQIVTLQYVGVCITICV